MASETDIANIAITLLGGDRIASIDDDVQNARDAKALFATSRDALLGGYNWCFAMDRAQLVALSTAPAFGFDYQYNFPADCLRIVFVGDYYVGIDLTDYRGAPTELFTIEGRRILTGLAAPLNLRYVKRVEDTGLFDPCFVKSFGCQLASDMCEAMTQSDTKRDRAEKALGHELSKAVRANAIQLPPQKLADDEWLMSRL